MDSSGTYKSICTTRGITYGYWICNSTHRSQDKPTLFFLHGYPASSYDWEAQFTYFSKKGYGVIAPDMLGYGGTDKPLNVQMYRAGEIAKDLVDILDKEGVEKAVVISHDWGTLPASRLINYFPERILANVFISLSYFPPDPNFDVEVLNEKIKQMTGENSFGYWEFFAADDAADVIIKHIDSFYSLGFSSNPMLMKTDLAPKGKFREWLENDKMGPGRANYWTEEEEEAHKQRFLATGVKASLMWYRARVMKVDNDDDSKIPQDLIKVPQPTLFIPTLQDYVCLPEVGVAAMKAYVENLTIREIDACHWVMFERRDELNEVLEEFFSGSSNK